MKLLAFNLLFIMLLVLRGGCEPEPPPLNMFKGEAPYFPTCNDIDPHCD